MKSKTALITGASRGLGETFTRHFWEAGYSLHLLARNRGALENIRSSLPPRTGQVCTVHTCDLGDNNQVRDFAKEVTAAGVNTLVNNAAIQGPIGPLCENDMLAWEQTMRVNLLSPVEICRALIPGMKAGNDGSIINISGGGATGPRGNFSAYSAAKAALVRFSETLAEEVRGFGIRVNCIAPGAMKTAMLAEVLERGSSASGQKEYEIAQRVFAEGGASMDVAAELAVFLASEAASGITGKLISAVWDKWADWPAHIGELEKSDVYTLRRITGRDRGFTWGDK